MGNLNHQFCNYKGTVFFTLEYRIGDKQQICISECIKTSAHIIQMQGIVATGLAWSLKIWCINKGGPLFVAVFQPLQTVMVAILAAIFLGDQLYTGG